MASHPQQTEALGELRVHHFKRDVALQVQVLRQKDGTHATFAEQLFDAIMIYLLADCCHRFTPKKDVLS